MWRLQSHENVQENDFLVSRKQQKEERSGDTGQQDNKEELSQIDVNQCQQQQ